MSSLFAQSTDFTCGPACLVAALNHTAKKAAFSQADELQIWREANTVYMGDGLPGTSAYGLALAAQLRGLHTTIYDFDHAHLFAISENPNNAARMETLLAIVKSDEARYRLAHGTVHYRRPWPDEVAAHLVAGDIAIVLATDQREGELHWVLVTGQDKKGNFILHDPYPYDNERSKKTDSFTLPPKRFWQWVSHTPANLQTFLFLRPFTSLDAEPDLPYLTQQTDFTCGPACLLSAIRLLKPALHLLPQEEFRIWRAANTIYMVDGHPGCGPHALAVQAQQYRLRAHLHAHNTLAMFCHWNRHNQKELPHITLMHGYDEQLAAAIPQTPGPFGLPDVAVHLAAGRLVMLLDTSIEAGHWLLVTGVTGHGAKRRWKVHDPLLEEGQTSPLHVYTDVQLAQKLVCSHTGGQAMLALSA